MYDGGGDHFWSGGYVVLRRVFGLFVMVVVLVSLVACSNNDDGAEQAEAEAISVELAEVVEDDIFVARSLFGRVSVTWQEAVMLPGPGEVSKVHVDNGAVVKKDDYLITLKTSFGEQKIVATKDGLIAKFAVREGDMLSGEEPLAIIVDVDEMEASFQMTRETRDLLQAGDEVDFLAGDVVLTGVVEPFDVLPNEAGQFDVVVTFDNTKAKLTAGDVVKLAVEEERLQDVLVLPTEALLSENGVSFVYVVEGNVAKRVQVDVVELQSDVAAVEGDLAAEDQVVVRGQFLLEDGSEVTVEKDGNES